jgi:hypothetical protein
MRSRIAGALAGTALLLPCLCFAADIAVHKARDIEVYRGSTIEPYKGTSVAPRAVTPQSVKPRRAEDVKPVQAGSVRPVTPAAQTRILTKEDLDEMHRNDVKAGRTRESMSKGDASKSSAARNPNPYNDPYNTGGWNYNTNQSASPIWNPNSQ